MDTAEHALQRFLDRLDQHQARLDTIRQQIVTVVREKDQPAPGSLLDLGDQFAVHEATVATAHEALMLIRDLIEGAGRDLDGEAQVMLGAVLATTETTGEVDLAGIDQFRNHAARMIADILIIGDLQDARIQTEDWPQPLLPAAALQALGNRIRQDATGEQPS